MTALAALLGFALVTSLAARRWLANASWTLRAPGLAIFAWQAVSFSVAGALVFAGGALVLPTLHVSVDLAEVLQACVTELRHQYQTPGGVAVAVLGGIASIAMLVRFVSVFASFQRRAAAHRRAMRSTLQLVGTPQPAHGYVEVSHGAPAVYCVPGRARTTLRRGLATRSRGEIVVTSGARKSLTLAQLDAVLTHERAHLRARHDVPVTAARALERTFFGLGIFAMARERITELVEMQADDAARDAQRRDLATALLRLVSADAPVGALGAGGATAVARVRRLARPAAPLAGREMILASAAVLSLFVTPLLLALMPSVFALFVDCCTVAAAF